MMGTIYMGFTEEGWGVPLMKESGGGSKEKDTTQQLQYVGSLTQIKDVTSLTVFTVS